MASIGKHPYFSLDVAYSQQFPIGNILTRIWFFQDRFSFLSESLSKVFQMGILGMSVESCH